MPSFYIILDKRSQKVDKTHPVKIKVYHSYQKRLYPTGIDLTEEGFRLSYLAEKPKGENKAIKDKLNAMLVRTKGIGESIKNFDFAKFDKLLRRPSSSTNDVFHYYTETIRQCLESERVKTAKSYESCQTSLRAFLAAKGRRADRLPFEAVTSSFLEDYERYMVKQGKQPATVGIYLRTLRAVLNLAMDDTSSQLDKSLYPFGTGNGKYQIPTGRKEKKALDKSELKKLFTHPIEKDDPILKARYFWFFSYQASGMNVKDIADLRNKNIKNGVITFLRSKTSRTAKARPKLIRVTVVPFLKEVISKYGNKSKHENAYVFPILNDKMTPIEKSNAVDAFNRYISQHMKKLAKIVGVDESISNMHARHSFATNAIRGGASKEKVQEQLGHHNLATTENYFKGFDDNTRKELEDKLMDFGE